MSVLVPPRRFDPAVREIMDRPGNDPDVLRQDLGVLQRINRWLGGRRIPLYHLAEFVRDRGPSPSRPLTILDLATGSGDIPREVARWAAHHGLRVAITAVDGNPEIVRIARDQCAGWPEICVERHDLLALPFAAGSFDVVLCALTLHHFTDGDAVAILRRIGQIARDGYVVNDLRRNRVAIGVGKLMARTIIRNPIARFDVPASCERAFTLAELRGLACRAGLENCRIRRHAFFRMALVGWR